MLEGAKYTKEVPFSSLFNWSVQYLNEAEISFNSSYPMVSIGSILTRNKTSINVEDGVTYKRVTIKVRNGGVVQRDSEIGDNIGTKRQYKVSEGQFILSKIDARNGAMGLIPKELEGAIVTQDFLPYDLDTAKINPQYLVLVSTTKEFVEFCQTCSSGTTNRQRVDEVKFLDIKIPLPTIEEQNKLVADYNKKMALAAKQESQASTKEQEIEEYLFDKLGVKIAKRSNSKLLNLVSFRNLSRWDVQFFFSGTSIECKYPVDTLSNCVSHFMKDEVGKSLRRDTSRTPNQEFRYIGMEHIEKNSGEVLIMPKVKGTEIKSQTVSVPKDYFVYGKLRPYLNKYWVNNTEFENIVCSSEFFVFKIKDSINQMFFKYVLASDIVQQQIAELSSGARMPRINEEIFMSIKLPIPQIEIQNEIATHISKLKQEIKKLRTAAESNRKAALANFEQKIF